MMSLLPKLIRWSFYIYFFLVPLTFWGDTSELFEFNKMWLTFIFAIIVGVLWIWRMIAEKRVIFKRTILDIPLVLFIISQLLSTFMSLDTHVSWWGYYSRFNGGMFSILSYIFIYYALISNWHGMKVTRLLQVTLLSGLAVCLWGLPSHFGYDPTCYIFRGTLDVSCWTDAFQPKVRIFSTLGQPDWLAAYLVSLVPLSLGFALNYWQEKRYYVTAGYGLLSVLFYLCFLYTSSRGGFLGLIAGLGVMAAGYLWMHTKNIKQAGYVIGSIFAVIVVITFFTGTPFNQLDKFTYPGIRQAMIEKAHPVAKITAPTTAQPVGELGGTDSGTIRLYVWRGALDAWRHYPLFGSGVETFAFVYYLYRPAGHNMTSEWDYLYNKAHNEYLNYLATTGAIGLLTYLAVIGMAVFLMSKIILKTKNSDHTKILVLSLLGGYVTMIVSNFFGFSVVVINLFLFVFPALAILLTSEPQKEISFKQVRFTTLQYGGFLLSAVVGVYLILILMNYWAADRAYAYGFNLDHANAYDRAYQPLMDAYTARPDEPTFSDELSVNTAILASAYAANKDASQAAQLAKQAVELSDQTITQHPNIVTYWKTRVRIMYTLAQLNDTAFAQFMPQALKAIQTAHMLAPTDAKIAYNYGLILSQNGKNDEAVAMLRKTIQLRPIYQDAYFALGVILHEQATDPAGKVVDQQKEAEAVSELRYLLTTFGDNQKVKDTLTSWGEQP